MARYKLKDLSLTNLEYGSGAATIPYDGKTRYVRITDIDDQGKLSSDFVSPSSIDDKYILNDGDILFARTGATVGKSFRYHTSDGRCLYAGFLIRVVPNQLLVRPDYLWFFTKSPKYKTFVQNSMKVVAQPNINAKQYGDLELYVPSLNEQDSIISIFSTIKATIELRQQQLQALDDLVKARFVEMFGDGEYPVDKLGNVCTKITDGTHKTPDYLDHGITFISAKNIIKGELDFSDVKYISEEEYQDIQKRCQTEKLDILLSKSGSLGSPAIIKTDEKLGLFESLAVLKYDRDRIIPEFLCEQLKTDRVQRQFTTGTKGVAIKHLHLGVISDTEIIVPPIDRQIVFAEFVKQISKSKVAIQKALDETQILFDGLMQKYFG